MSKKTGKGFKVLVVNDMEGISGIDDWHQIFAGCKEFESFGRVQVTEDVNAAARGLKSAGATQIGVVDFHGSGGPSRNVIPEKLEKGAEIYQGPNLPNRLKEAVDKSTAAAVFIGFHAMADTEDGFLRHTINMDPRIKINGKPVGETAINAYTLGEYGVPVIMVSGDQALIREAKAFLHEVETAQVKISTDSKTTKCLPPVKSRKLIEATAKRALLRIDDFKPTQVKKPIRMDISFPTKEQAEPAKMIPRAKALSSKTVSYTAASWDEAEMFMMTTLSLANDFHAKNLVAKLGKLKGAEKAMLEWAENRINDWLG